MSVRRAPPRRPPHRPAGQLAIATVLLLSTVLAACGEVGRSAPTAPWGAAAEARFDAEVAAAHEGVADHVAYYAADLHRDDVGWRRDGRDSWLQELRSAYGMTLDELTYTRTAVDRTGAAVELTLDHVHGVDGPVELLEVRRYGRDGVAAVVRSMPLATARSLPTAVGAAAFEALEELAAGYVRVWSGDVSSRVDELYTPDARLGDDLAGVELTGHAAIGRYRTETAAGDLRVAALPGGDAQAVYLDHRVAAAVRHLTLVVVGTGEQGCPGREVRELELDADRRVVAERRFHAVAHARRCLTALPPGWWDVLEPRGGHDDVVVLRLGGRDVPVHGASLEEARLLHWSVDRFAVAGLPAPPLASVTFAGATGRCAGIAGRVTPRGQGTADVLLCLDENELCRDEECAAFRLGAQQTVLHELAHVWEHRWLDDDQRARYREATGSPTWLGGDDAWADRAGERAAEVLMWGLLGRPTSLPRVGDPPCARLVDEFRLLTGTDPICGRCP
jgi:hypothetical protein